MSHLHARKKSIHAHDLEQGCTTGLSDIVIVEPPSSGSPTSKKASRKSQHVWRWWWSPELGAALTAVVAFLAIGLLLGYFLLHHQHRKVILHVMQDPWAHGRAIIRSREGFEHHFFSGSPRFVTVVMPSVVNAKGRQLRLNSIQDTWGPSSRAIFVVHNISEFPNAEHAVISEDTYPEDPYSFPQLLLVPPEIGVDDGLQRLYHTVRTIYEKVDPDFAFFVNDHTFVIPEHLCKFLDHKSPTHDMYAGHALKNQKDVFNSGAAGYLLSRITMEKLVQKWNQEDPTCWLDKNAPKWLQGNPGLVTVQCLSSMGIRATDTRARARWHRFHAFPLTRVVSGNVDEWYIKKHKGLSHMTNFPVSYDHLLSGEDCCSKDSVSFHYVEYVESKALFATREALLDNPQMTDSELKEMMVSSWPKGSDIGAYSRGLPRENDKNSWIGILKTIRKISTRATQSEC